MTAYTDVLDAAWAAHLQPHPPGAPTVVSTFAGCGGSSLGYSMAGYHELLTIEWDAHAAGLLRRNFPGVPCWQGDITKFDPTKFTLEPGELDVLDGSPPCFPAGTPVLTARGVLPIEDVRVDDRVLTHTGRWQPVTATMSRTAVVGHASWGSATMDHPFWARRHLPQPAEQPFTLGPARFIPAGELTDHGEFVAIPAVVPALDIPLPAASASGEPFWWMVGRWLGDGWVRRDDGEDTPARPKPGYSRTPVDCLQCGAPAAKHTRPGYEHFWTAFCGAPCRHMFRRAHRRARRADVIICCGTHEADGIAGKLADAGLHWNRQDAATTVKFSTGSRELVEWFGTNFGQGAAGKTLPGWLFGAPVMVRDAVLAGYLSADGHQRGGRWTAATVSGCLAVGVRLLATGLGLTTSLSRYHPQAHRVLAGRMVNQKTIHEVRVGPDDHRYTRVDGQHRWVKIRRPLVPGAPEPVYDLTVDQDHSFIAWGMVVHNCQGFSTSGLRRLDDPRNQLFREFVRLIDVWQPKVFVMENVPGMARGHMKALFVQVMDALRGAGTGYRVSCRLVWAKWLGVPQDRRRLVFVGVREDLNLDPVHPAPHGPIWTFRDACADIIDDSAGTPTMTEQLGNGRTRTLAALVPPGSAGSKVMVANGKKGNFFSLSRVAWDLPSRTLMKSNEGAACPMHPSRNRPLSTKEMARLQSFPDQYVWNIDKNDPDHPKRQHVKIAARIGNSVPPLMMKAIADTIRTRLLQPLVDA